jgi:hypothetical protein
MDHWQRRLERLLRRPKDEEPLLTIYFDGLNHEPSVRWIPLLKTLQADPFVGCVHVIVHRLLWNVAATH